MAIVIADALQGKGLGTELGLVLVDAALRHGVRRFTATMLADNVAARKLFGRISHELHTHVEHGTLALVADLAGVACGRDGVLHADDPPPGEVQRERFGDARRGARRARTAGRRPARVAAERRETRQVLSREYAPVEQVALRGEIAGPATGCAARRRPRRRQRRGAGAGRCRKRLRGRARPGESAYEALARGRCRPPTADRRTARGRTAHAPHVGAPRCSASGSAIARAEAVGQRRRRTSRRSRRRRPAGPAARRRPRCRACRRRASHSPPRTPRVRTTSRGGAVRAPSTARSPASVALATSASSATPACARSAPRAASRRARARRGRGARRRRRRR